VPAREEQAYPLCPQGRNRGYPAAPEAHRFFGLCAAQVGHTGDLAAAVQACAKVDECLGELLAVVDSLNGRWLVTSDHGNSDDMVQRNKKTGEPLMDEYGKPLQLTSHTLAPVPVAIGGAGLPSAVVLRKDLPNAGARARGCPSPSSLETLPCPPSQRFPAFDRQLGIPVVGLSEVCALGSQASPTGNDVVCVVCVRMLQVWQTSPGRTSIC
jgi:Metalloenzyme superfamily